ncbi:AraC family transcriptional regulator [Lacticaseibacillus sp. GG6-2]
MPISALIKQLQALNPTERRQQTTHSNVNSLDLDYIHDPIPQMPVAHFFDNSDIAVAKNSRFSYVPAHTHEFIEMNYQFSGHSTQFINGEKIILQPHQLLLMDTAIVQQIESTGTNDLLINLLLKDDATVDRLFATLPATTNRITEFLYNAVQVNTLHNNFILFDLSDQPIAIDLIECLLFKGLNPIGDQQTSMTLLLLPLLLELPTTIIKSFTNFADVTHDRLLPVLDYINHHYADATLTAVSAHFNYNANYLSNKLRASTGHSFKELVDRRRLAVAQNLMIKTPLSLNAICEQIGYQNPSSLFRLFMKYLQTSPSDYKHQVTQHASAI